MITLKNVSIKYVKEFYSLYNINLNINGNTLLIGDAASGNIFLLRLLAKIDTHYDGEILVDNKNLKQIKDKDLNIAYIPQKPCLFENKTVLENLIYPLKIRKINKIEAILRAKTAIKPYFLKICENFNITNTDKNKLNNNLNDSDYNKCYNDKSTLNFNKDRLKNDFENKKINKKVTQNGKQTYEDFLDANVKTLTLNNEKFEELFENFLNTKIKKLDLGTKKILTLLRAKVRAPKYVLIENFFDNLDENYLDLANEIISNITNNSTIIATQNDNKLIPAYNDFNQIVFDAGSIKK